MSQTPLLRKIEQNAASAGDEIAIECGGLARTWWDLGERTRQLGAALAAIGCSAGTRVAVLASGSIEHIEVQLGILRSGASVVPLPPLASATTLGRMLVDADVRAIFVSKGLRSLADSALTGETGRSDMQRIGIDFDDDHWRALEALLAQGAEGPDLPEISPQQEFNLIYTSGTTGTPKGIMQSHQLRTAQMAAAQLIGIDRSATLVISTVLCSNWTLFGLYASLYGGGRTVLLPRFEPADFLRCVRRDRVTHALLVPAQIRQLLAQPDFDRSVRNRPALKLSAGSPLSVRTKRELMRRWPGGLIENYGLTEGAPTTLLFAHLHPDRLDSVGTVLPGGEIRIIDDAGRELPTGETGEVVGHTMAMMDAYHNRPEATAELEWFDPEGKRFFRSGDVGCLDTDGFLYLKGRKKDVVISGGLNIYAKDIEDVLTGHPDVLEAAVIGVPSERWGETPLALVVMREDSVVGEGELQDWANARLDKTQRLSAVEFRDTLPRGNLDKVLKNELRKPYWPAGGADQ
jgi:acyl-CoA synthetase (AMP-forming)/AMP-acid ligase II